jgi:LacI family transcriptional regulator
MTHRFPIKEIALQAGLSTATIDRVINNRAHISPQTRARVVCAIAELEQQESQMSARGRRMFFDFVIEAPFRFSREVQGAAEQVLGQITGAVCRPRFLLQEVMEEIEVVAALNRIAKRGSQGVCLKARDVTNIQTAVDRLISMGIPVVTLVTDVQGSNRVAYVGLDNHSAGRTAAYLVASVLNNVVGTVLAIRSNDRFLGEEEREIAFKQALLEKRPNLRVISVSGGGGIHYETSRLLSGAVNDFKDLKAVYSMGGGNRTILEILDDHNLHPDVYIAHDLDVDNRELIAGGHVNFILHHDLKADILNVFQTFLQFHKLFPNGALNRTSNVQVITPENIPD